MVHQSNKNEAAEEHEYEHELVFPFRYLPQKKDAF